MQGADIQKHHLQSFAKLPILERLGWAFAQQQFLMRFMDDKAKRLYKKIRRNGKKYFKA